MDDKITESLDEVLVSQLESLKDSKKPDEEKQKAVDNLVKLYKLRQDDTKLEIDAKKVVNESEEIRNKLNSDICDRTNRLDEQRKDRAVKIALELTGLIVPLICYGIWVNKGLEFEKNGTFTSSVFRALINRFKPTKN